MRTTTMTVRPPAEVEERIDLLTERTWRPRSVLASEAIAGRVGRELATIEGIDGGFDDLRAGRAVSHDQVMAEVRLVIEDAGKAHRCGLLSENRKLKPCPDPQRRGSGSLSRGPSAARCGAEP